VRFLVFGLKNIARNRRRSATILGMIALGSAALLIAGGYAAATFRGLREGTIANGLGHLQIGGPRFRDEEERPLATGLDDPGAVRRIVRDEPGVRAVAARIEFNGLVSNGEKSVVFLGRGVEPEEEFGAAGFRLTLREGRELSASGAEAVVAIGLAKSLHVKPGDRLTILSTTTEGALNGADVQVVGTYTTGIREMDDRALIVSLGTAQTILATSKVSKLIVVLNETGDTAAVQKSLTSRLSDAQQRVELANWSDLASFYHQVRGLYSGIFIFLGLIIVGLVVLSSGNAMSMTVMERVKEIGTLMAVGTSRRLVLLLFMLEGLGLGVLGGLLGVVLGYALAVSFNAAGIMMPPPPTFTTGFRLVIDTVPALFVAVPLLMVVTLFVASLLPAARAARLRITEALLGILLIVAFAGDLGAEALRDQASEGSAEALRHLQASDQFRGGWPSVVVRTRIDNFDGDKLSESADFEVLVKGDNSLVRFLSPRAKGQALLMRGDDMWFFLPAVARPMRITPIQRLIGNTSNGDLARLRYADDYSAALAGEETIDGVRCVVLDLQAKRKAATYQRIRYAIRKSDSMPVRAELFVGSGRQLRTAYFEDPKMFGGRSVITRIVIFDQVNTRSKTVMTFTAFEPKAIDGKVFNPSRGE
jgi:putative ABC transport system permease protein